MNRYSKEFWETETRMATQSLDDPRFGDLIGGWHDIMSLDVMSWNAEETKAFLSERMAEMRAKRENGGEYTLRLVEVTTNTLEMFPHDSETSFK